MPRQIQGSQTDFSFGEVDVSLKRVDTHPARKAGLRQMSNFRILNSGALQTRSGRSALFPITQGLLRIEEFTISSGNNFKIGFGPGRLQITDLNGAVAGSFADQGNGAALPWATSADIASIRYALFNQSIYVCFGHSMRPQVVSWDGVSTWTIADYTEAIGGSNQKRTPFYRISPQNILMLPSGTGGAANIIFNANILVPNMVGTRMRFCGRQMLITSLVSSSKANVTIEENLPPGELIVFSTDPSALFSIGDVVLGTVSGAQGIVTAISSGGASINVQLLQLSGQLTAGSSSSNAQTGSTVYGFVLTDTVAGPGGALGSITGVSNTIPQAVSVWDDEVMNDFRGYPASVFVDQFRLGFCDFPSVPGGISWSAINSPTDLYVDASSPDNGMFELIPARARVQDVVPGAESSEFVFCDSVIYYIPISPTNPLAPGSVSFQLLSSDGAASVQPRRSQEVIVYANAGGNSMMAVIAVGDYYRPFRTKDLSQFHQHLFDEIVAIAVPTADAQFNERYAYVLNASGSLVVGKYNLGDLSAEGQIPKIGWGPWSGAGVTEWVSAWNGDVHFTSTYFGVGICEQLDNNQFLDCALPVNALPAAFTPPGGKGPLWFIPSQSVTLMDQNTRAMGTYQIDANGFIIPQFNGGENLAVASLVAGQPWTMTAEPFAPVSQPGGVDVHQRMMLRQISNISIYVVNSTGFLFQALFSAKQTPSSPALGAPQQYRRVPAWNQGDDATKPPPLRETVESWPAPGSSYDPRVAIIKDTPGPLIIAEIGMEISI